jgi:glycosyltransferase involved in cell wall biosynthesis
VLGPDAGGERLAGRQRRAVDAGLDGRMRFAGFRRDVPSILAALDGLVHPARYEAYGLAVHEAICRGVPAIVSASAGIAEQYPRDLADLLLDDPNDSAELAERLLVWRRHLERFKAAVIPFSGRLHAHTWDAMAAQIAALVGRNGTI